jgi:putative transposase
MKFLIDNSHHLWYTVAENLYNASLENGADALASPASSTPKRYVCSLEKSCSRCLALVVRLLKCQAPDATPRRHPSFRRMFGSPEKRCSRCLALVEDAVEVPGTWPSKASFRRPDHEHHHSGLGLMTPAVVHYGLADEVYEQRCQVLASAYQVHPERFVHGEPRPPRWPDEVWINPRQSSHSDIDSAEDAMDPGRQPGSPARPRCSLDMAEYLFGPEQASEQPDDMKILHPKFEHRLPQNH